MENKAMGEYTICNVNKSDFSISFKWVQNRALHESIWKGIKYKVIFKMTGEVGDIYISTMLTDGKKPLVTAFHFLIIRN